MFGCACSDCPSFIGGDNDNIYTCTCVTTASEGPSTAPTLTLSRRFEVRTSYTGLPRSSCGRACQVGSSRWALGNSRKTGTSVYSGIYYRCLRQRREGTLNMHPRRQLTTRAVMIHWLNSNISKIGTANHINCSRVRGTPIAPRHPSGEHLLINNNVIPQIKQQSSYHKLPFVTYIWAYTCACE